MKEYKIKNRKKGKLEKKELDFAKFLLNKLGESLAIAGLLTLFNGGDTDYFLNSYSIVYASNVTICLAVKEFLKYKKFKLEREAKEKRVYFDIQNAIDDKLTEQEDYIKLKNLYNKVLENFVKICKQIGAKTPMEIYQVFLAFYHNGLFLYNKSKENDILKLIDREYDDIYGLLGLEVFTGLGVCRHSAIFLSDIFKKFGFESCVQIMYMAGEFFHNCSEDIKKNMIEKGNHAITYVKDKGINYMLCPENVFCVALEYDEYRMIDFCRNDVISDENMKLISPSSLDDYTLKKAGVDCELLESMNPTKFLTKEEYVSEFYKTLGYTDNRFKAHFLIYGENLYDYFYKSNVSLFQESIKLKESLINFRKSIYLDYDYDVKEKKLIKRKLKKKGSIR